MAEIDREAKIGINVSFSPDTVIGKNVTIGNNVTFYPGVTIGASCTIFDGAILGKPPMGAGNTTRPISKDTQSLIIGSGCVIGANAVIYMGIRIGEKVLIGDLASIREGCVLGDQVVVGRACLVMYDSIIGNRSRIIDGAILTGNMVIEEDVFIGPRVSTINDNDVYLTRFGLERFVVQGPTVRRFALIGTAANIAAGVEIGMGAIVAPSAMVIHDVPPWTVVAGVPAKFVREINNETRARILTHFHLQS